MANALSSFVVEKRLVMPHTKANKVAGLMILFAPFAIPLFGIAVPGALACAMATFAAVQKGHLIRTGLTRA